MEPISSLQAEEARLRSKLANNPFFSSASNFFQFLRWMLISTLTGLVVGSVSTIFNFGMKIMPAQTLLSTASIKKLIFRFA